MEFFKSQEYLKFAKSIPDGHSSHIYPLAISIFVDSPWKRIADMSPLMMNWVTENNIPFNQNSWLEPYKPTPNWPHKYVNHDIPCS